MALQISVHKPTMNRLVRSLDQKDGDGSNRREHVNRNVNYGGRSGPVAKSGRPTAAGEQLDRDKPDRIQGRGAAAPDCR
jgi:hypothetical protein